MSIKKICFAFSELALEIHIFPKQCQSNFILMLHTKLSNLGKYSNVNHTLSKNNFGGNIFSHLWSLYYATKTSFNLKIGRGIKIKIDYVWFLFIQTNHSWIWFWLHNCVYLYHILQHSPLSMSIDLQWFIDWIFNVYHSVDIFLFFRFCYSLKLLISIFLSE